MNGDVRGQKRVLKAMETSNFHWLKYPGSGLQGVCSDKDTSFIPRPRIGKSIHQLTNSI